MGFTNVAPSDGAFYVYADVSEMVSATIQSCMYRCSSPRERNDFRWLRHRCYLGPVLLPSVDVDAVGNPIESNYRLPSNSGGLFSVPKTWPPRTPAPLVCLGPRARLLFARPPYLEPWQRSIVFFGTGAIIGSQDLSGRAEKDISESNTLHPSLSAHNEYNGFRYCCRQHERELPCPGLAVVCNVRGP